MNVLEFDDVRAVYGPYKALNGLSFSVQSGEAVAVLGRNGAGKSTVARVASGLVRAAGGDVRVFGHSIRRTSPSRLARQGVVHLPEGVGLFSGLTIEENLVLRIGGATRAERAERLARAYDGLGTLRDRRRSKAGQLSGGQQRLVAVTGAIVAEPRILLADEPTLGLSPAAADDVYEALTRLSASATALLLIETRLGRVEALCSRALVLTTGVAHFDGPIGEVRGVLESLLDGTASLHDDRPSLFDARDVAASIGSERAADSERLD